MYERSAGLGAFKLPRFLTPPKWLRKVAGIAVKGSQVTVPTPVGPQVFDLGNPDSLRALQALVTGTKLGLKPAPTPGHAGQITRIAEGIPGGWLTIGAVAIGAFLLLGGMGRRRRA